MPDQKPLSAPVLAPGFADPVHDAQRCFRAVMMAMAQPGTLKSFDPGSLAPPQPLSPMGAALALTLFDYDTPVWLDGSLRKSPDVSAFLTFHTGARIVSEPVDAQFALINDPRGLMPLCSFDQGSLEYPDRAATLILCRTVFGQGDAALLAGPGLKEPKRFSAGLLPPAFWRQAADNNTQFPRGVDVIFAGATEVAALPRSTTITPMEA
ncbi:carbon-phosphorus lyase subunit PhnH [Roseibium aquae]|uniref:Carbon-phosphorus lyase subunit PhnH n=1 Tax=Roseibium aquae TaxID=1323746 RepID=A0A916WYH6_9HYPH|nr:phosphonate C-P lyase system protein PhnH [Roseibium aquae]GGB39312.1 carbon-phosphorus lyase subunit PhnH [Roseibium aquae]